MVPNLGVEPLWITGGCQSYSTQRLSNLHMYQNCNRNAEQVDVCFSKSSVYGLKDNRRRRFGQEMILPISPNVGLQNVDTGG